jgi:endonuclease/exonuclease/phosphatase family metal-dependent hydrolase
MDRLWRSACDASLAVILLGCCLFIGTSSAVAADEELSAKVMTFNIRCNNPADGQNGWPYRREMAVKLIERLGTDFVGVQEPLPDQVADLKKMLPDYHALGRSREADVNRGESVLILYRHKRWRLDPKESGSFWLSDTPETPGSNTWGSACTRMVMWGRFLDQKTGRGVYVYNTHFDHVSESARQQSATSLANRIAKRGHPAEPVVVTGDFNAGESSKAVLYLVDKSSKSPIRLIDTFRVVHPHEQNVNTYHAFEGGTKGEKIDYILALPGTKVVASEIHHDNTDGRYPSDHFPMTAEMTFSR